MYDVTGLWVPYLDTFVFWPWNYFQTVCRKTYWGDTTTVTWWIIHGYIKYIHVHWYYTQVGLYINARLYAFNMQLHLPLHCHHRSHHHQTCRSSIHRYIKYYKYVYIIYQRNCIWFILYSIMYIFQYSIVYCIVY